jgi:hypothetical protein
MHEGPRPRLPHATSERTGTAAAIPGSSLRSDQQRLWAIRLKLADAVGRLKALTRLKTSRERAALRAGRTVATLEAVDTATADLAEAKAHTG